MRVWTSAVACSLALSAACVRPELVACGDQLCPIGDGCALDGSCVESGRLDACVALVDGDACEFQGAAGTCRAGACNAAICGDGRISPPEQCEGDDLDGATCLTYGFYEPAGLRCGVDCLVDTSSCVGRCGDGIKNGPELCDTVPGSELFTCYEVGFDYGSITCSADLCAPLYDRCFVIGWSPNSHSGDFPTEVWSPHLGDVYVGLGASKMLHVTDAESIEIDLPGSCGNGYAPIWSAPTGEVVVAGFERLCQFDGTAWTSMLMPGGLASVGDLWGTGMTDLYATGSELVHYDGQTWTAVATGAPPGRAFERITGRATRVLATSTDSVAILDGTWRFELVASGENVSSPWISENGTFYVLGTMGAYRRDGAGWALIPGPPGGLMELWGIGNSPYGYRHSDAIWFLDTSGTWIAVDNPGNLSHMAGSHNSLVVTQIYDLLGECAGYAWSPLQSIPTGVTAIWGSSLTNVVAITNGFSHHFDGDSWSTRALPWNTNIERIWSHDASVVIGVGSAGTILELMGGVWLNLSLPSPIEFHDVAGEGSGPVFAVGASPSNASGEIFVRETSGWRRAFSYTGPQVVIRRIWSSAVRGSYAIIDGGEVMLHHPPGTPPENWVAVQLPDDLPVAVWGDDDQLIVTFVNRRVYRYAQGVWTKLTTRLQNAPDRLIGSAGDVIGISFPGQLIRWDGVTWDRVRVPATIGTSGVTAAFTSDAVTVVGGDAGVLVMIRPE